MCQGCPAFRRGEDFKTGEDCLSAIRELAPSQGSYGRMLEQIESKDEESLKRVLATFERQEFKDPVELIL